MKNLGLEIDLGGRRENQGPKRNQSPPKQPPPRPK